MSRWELGVDNGFMIPLANLSNIFNPWPDHCLLKKSYQFIISSRMSYSRLLAISVINKIRQMMVWLNLCSDSCSSPAVLYANVIFLVLNMRVPVTVYEQSCLICLLWTEAFCCFPGEQLHNLVQDQIVPLDITIESFYSFLKREITVHVCLLF